MTKNKLQGNGHGHMTETPDVSHVRNVDVIHETSDVNVVAILKFVMALTVMTIVVYVLMWLMFKFFNARVEQKEPPPGPMAMSERERLPPEPRLQGAPGFAEDIAKSVADPHPEKPKDPLWEIRVLREQWERELREGPKDQSGNPIGLPIEQAMQKILEGQGLPSRPQQSTPQELKDQGTGTPTAASSGRVSVKGKQ
ncbi:MAG: hypothetical protein ACREBG_26135 [Pyrinomonadaceae bacterium]